MRIDFVITEMFVGGAERCLTELAVRLSKNGDHVRVFCFANFPQGKQRLLVNRLEEEGIPVESGHADKSYQFLKARRRLISWLADSPPDICQTFLFHANVLGSAAARKAGAKVVVGGVRIADANWFRLMIEKPAIARVDSVICVSDAVQRFVAERLACEPPKSIVIPNSVDVTRFATSRPIKWSAFGWPDDSAVTLFVGRLHPQKGIELLQEQIDTIAPAGTQRRLLLIGKGPLQSELQAWADSIGSDRVKLLDWQPDIAPFIKAARLLVLPSHYEGMPNVVMEAMASGKPVVCSRVEGSDELMSHDREGQTFPAGDSNAMKELVNKFLTDESLCLETGLQNQSRMRTDFSIPTMVAAYRSHYKDLLMRCH